MVGPSIVIQDVNRHHSGFYMCTADNNVGQPATAEIDLKVLCKFSLPVYDLIGLYCAFIMVLSYFYYMFVVIKKIYQEL